MGLGTGALAVIGGTVVIIGFLTLSTGALIAVQGYNTLSNVGLHRSGRKRYTQADLANPYHRTWQSMLVPPAPPG